MISPHILTDTQKTRFFGQWAAGVPIKAIAFSFGIPVPNVSATARRLGLPLRKMRWSADMVSELMFSWRNMPHGYLAKELGVTVDQLNGKARRLGLPFGSRP
jgi:hypothetical protein